MLRVMKLSLVTLAAVGSAHPNLGVLDVFGPSTSRYAVTELPGMKYNLPQSWAGLISIPDTRDNSLFFWLFEAEDKAYSNNLIIWLNGGPGCTSLLGLTVENGPLKFAGEAKEPEKNPYSWTRLANVLYIDQPVGTGYSTGSDPANNNAQVKQHFYNWLRAFYSDFPRLLRMKTYLMGESYAGIYIPYFAGAILDNHKRLPVNLKSISIGNPSFGNAAAMTDVTANKWMQLHNRTLKIPQNVLSIFDEADAHCGFTPVLDLLTYPPQGNIVIPGNPEQENYRLANRNGEDCATLAKPKTLAQINESIYNTDCFGPCATWSTAKNYLSMTRPCFNVFNVHDTCNDSKNASSLNAVAYLNRPEVRFAIHAPGKTAVKCNDTVMGLSPEEVEPPAYSIIPGILEQNVDVHIYSGDYDSLLNHVGSELVIQNMSWCGKQGLSHSPDKEFIVNDEIAGRWGYERGLTYHHFYKAGHLVPQDQAAAAFTFVKDFVVGARGYRFPR